MNNNSMLEYELSELGKTLRRAPSVAPDVLAQIREISVDMPVVLLPARRSPWLAGFATTLATVAAVLAVMFFFRTEGIAFAQIQKRMAAVQSASYYYQTLAESHNAKPKHINDAQVMVHNNGRARVEMADGSMVITNRKIGKRLITDFKNQSATLSYVFDNQDEANLLTVLQSLPEDPRAQVIASREINGEKCVGFRIDKPDLVLRVWVSPSSLLPVLAEFRQTEPSAVSGETASDRAVFVTTFSELQFDISLADELFSLQPPPNFAVVEIGEPPSRISNIFHTTPRILPLKGVGPLKLGMAKSEALKLLGAADRETVTTPTLPQIGEDTDQVDDQPRPSKASRLAMLTEYHSLHYFELGLRLDFEVQEGLIGIVFDKQVQLADQVEFPGSLATGIGLGSPERDVIAAYGRPSSIYGFAKSILWYQDLGLKFQLSERRTVSVLYVEKGGEKKYRFEWREPDEQDEPNGK